jgi:hypothetical protein
MRTRKSELPKSVRNLIGVKPNKLRPRPEVMVAAHRVAHAIRFITKLSKMAEGTALNLKETSAKKIFSKAYLANPEIVEEIDFRDAVLGAEKEIILGSQKKLRVKIPAGVETGKKLRFSGQASGGGDAYVEIHVKPSERFKRVGNNIEIDWPIGLAQAVLGGEVEVPTVDGMVKLTVPPAVSRFRTMGSEEIRSSFFLLSFQEKLILK